MEKAVENQQVVALVFKNHRPDQQNAEEEKRRKEKEKKRGEKKQRRSREGVEEEWRTHALCGEKERDEMK